MREKNYDIVTLPNNEIRRRETLYEGQNSVIRQFEQEAAREYRELEEEAAREAEFGFGAVLDCILMCLVLGTVTGIAFQSIAIFWLSWIFYFIFFTIKNVREGRAKIEAVRQKIAKHKEWHVPQLEKRRNRIHIERENDIYREELSFNEWNSYFLKLLEYDQQIKIFNEWEEQYNIAYKDLKYKLAVHGGIMNDEAVRLILLDERPEFGRVPYKPVPPLQPPIGTYYDEWGRSTWDNSPSWPLVNGVPTPRARRRF